MLKQSTVAFLIAISAPGLALAQVPDSAKSDTAQKLQTVKIREAKARSKYIANENSSATKLPTALRDLPQSVTSVTSAFMKDQRMKSIGDVARYVPGVTMGQGEGNRDQPTIRGNSTTADFFVDGVRDDAQYFRDTYNLERLEALKGSNAMAFGRGGGGGVLNRVTKGANGITGREVSAEFGSFGARRITTDLQQRISSVASARLNSVNESSETFRDGVSLERIGLNPTLSISNNARTTSLSAGYEYFYDWRTADRGIPSLQGRPVDTSPATFFGNPEQSWARMRLNAVNATVAHTASFGSVRNRASFSGYRKFYQNIYPSGATAIDATLSAYNHDIDRRNYFNQTDVIIARNTGSIQHDVVAGLELGHQVTDNFRNTGYFGTTTSVKVPLSNPTYLTPVEFRQSATDANNGSTVNTGAVYLLDQLSLTPQLRVIAGARWESFGLRYDDNRSGISRWRTDAMISPRAGIVFKPSAFASLYANYSVSHLPGSGDQFGSLTDVTQELKPERFTNYELGGKWDVLDRLALTAAAYRLDRTNTRATDPADATRIVQTGAQRSSGFEFGAMGKVIDRWEMSAGFARQRATIARATSASAAGATVPLVPAVSASLWNKVTITKRIAIASGIIKQSELYAAIDNKVTLPAFTRFDGGLFADFGKGIHGQLNIENIANRRYFASSNGNQNITPGSPRVATFSLTTIF